MLTPLSEIIRVESIIGARSVGIWKTKLPEEMLRNSHYLLTQHVTNKTNWPSHHAVHKPGGSALLQSLRLYERQTQRQHTWILWCAFQRSLWYYGAAILIQDTSDRENLQWLLCRRRNKLIPRHPATRLASQGVEFVLRCRCIYVPLPCVSAVPEIQKFGIK